MALTFVRADLTQHRGILMRFNLDYAGWVGEGVLKYFGLELTGHRSKQRCGSRVGVWRS